MLEQVKQALEKRGYTVHIFQTAQEVKDYLLSSIAPHQSVGFGGSMTMVVGVDLDGKVTGIAVTSHRETLDMGTPALEQEYLHRFVGRSGTLSLNGSNRIDAVSGATVTSKAIITGVNRALAIVANLNTDENIIYTDGEV